MSTAQVILLLSSVILLGFGTLQLGLGLFLAYLAKQLPQLSVFAERVGVLEAQFTMLDRTVRRLKTSKGGYSRNREQEEVDPRLSGLSPEERALFQFGETAEVEQ